MTCIMLYSGQSQAVKELGFSFLPLSRPVKIQSVTRSSLTHRDGAKAGPTNSPGGIFNKP